MTVSEENLSFWWDAEATVSSALAATTSSISDDAAAREEQNIEFQKEEEEETQVSSRSTCPSPSAAMGIGKDCLPLPQLLGVLREEWKGVLQTSIAPFFSPTLASSSAIPSAASLQRITIASLMTGLLPPPLSSFSSLSGTPCLASCSWFCQLFACFLFPVARCAEKIVTETTLSKGGPLWFPDTPCSVSPFAAPRMGHSVVTHSVSLSRMPMRVEKNDNDVEPSPGLPLLCTAEEKEEASRLLASPSLTSEVLLPLCMGWTVDAFRELLEMPHMVLGEPREAWLSSIVSLFLLGLVEYFIVLETSVETSTERTAPAVQGLPVCSSLSSPSEGKDAEEFISDEAPPTTTTRRISLGKTPSSTSRIVSESQSEEKAEEGKSSPPAFVSPPSLENRREPKEWDGHAILHRYATELGTRMGWRSLSPFFRVEGASGGAVHLSDETERQETENNTHKKEEEKIDEREKIHSTSFFSLSLPFLLRVFPTFLEKRMTSSVKDTLEPQHTITTATTTTLHARSGYPSSGTPTTTSGSTPWFTPALLQAFECFQMVAKGWLTTVLTYPGPPHGSCFTSTRLAPVLLAFFPPSTNAVREVAIGSPAHRMRPLIEAGVKVFTALGEGLSDPSTHASSSSFSLPEVVVPFLQCYLSWKAALTVVPGHTVHQDTKGIPSIPFAAASSPSKTTTSSMKATNETEEVSSPPPPAAILAVHRLAVWWLPLLARFLQQWVHALRPVPLATPTTLHNSVTKEDLPSPPRDPQDTTTGGMVSTDENTTLEGPSSSPKDRRKKMCRRGVPLGAPQDTSPTTVTDIGPTKTSACLLPRACREAVFHFASSFLCSAVPSLMAFLLPYYSMVAFICYPNPMPLPSSHARPVVSHEKDTPPEEASLHAPPHEEVMGTHTMTSRAGWSSSSHRPRQRTPEHPQVFSKTFFSDLLNLMPAPRIRALSSALQEAIDEALTEKGLHPSQFLASVESSPTAGGDTETSTSVGRAFFSSSHVCHPFSHVFPVGLAFLLQPKELLRKLLHASQTGLSPFWHPLVGRGGEGESGTTASSASGPSITTTMTAPSAAKTPTRPALSSAFSSACILWEDEIRRSNRVTILLRDADPHTATRHEAYHSTPPPPPATLTASSSGIQKSSTTPPTPDKREEKEPKGVGSSSQDASRRSLRPSEGPLIKSETSLSSHLPPHHQTDSTGLPFPFLPWAPVLYTAKVFYPSYVAIFSLLHQSLRAVTQWGVQAWTITHPERIHIKEEEENKEKTRTENASSSSFFSPFTDVASDSRDPYEGFLSRLPHSTLPGVLWELAALQGTSVEMIQNGPATVAGQVSSHLLSTFTPSSFGVSEESSFLSFLFHAFLQNLFLSVVHKDLLPTSLASSSTQDPAITAVAADFLGFLALVMKGEDPFHPCGHISHQQRRSSTMRRMKTSFSEEEAHAEGFGEKTDDTSQTLRQRGADGKEKTCRRMKEEEREEEEPTAASTSMVASTTTTRSTISSSHASIGAEMEKEAPYDEVMEANVTDEAEDVLGDLRAAVSSCLSWNGAVSPSTFPSCAAMAWSTFSPTSSKERNAMTPLHFFTFLHHRIVKNGQYGYVSFFLPSLRAAGVDDSIVETKEDLLLAPHLSVRPFRTTTTIHTKGRNTEEKTRDKEEEGTKIIAACSTTTSPEKKEEGVPPSTSTTSTLLRTDSTLDASLSSLLSFGPLSSSWVYLTELPRAGYCSHGRPPLAEHLHEEVVQWWQAWLFEPFLGETASWTQKRVDAEKTAERAPQEASPARITTTMTALTPDIRKRPHVSTKAEEEELQSSKKQRKEAEEEASSAAGEIKNDSSPSGQNDAVREAGPSAAAAAAVGDGSTRVVAATYLVEILIEVGVAVMERLLRLSFSSFTGLSSTVRKTPLLLDADMLRIFFSAWWRLCDEAIFPSSCYRRHLSEVEIPSSTATMTSSPSAGATMKREEAPDDIERSARAMYEGRQYVKRLVIEGITQRRRIPPPPPERCAALTLTLFVRYIVEQYPSSSSGVAREPLQEAPGEVPPHVTLVSVPEESEAREPPSSPTHPPKTIPDTGSPSPSEEDGHQVTAETVSTKENAAVVLSPFPLVATPTREPCTSSLPPPPTFSSSLVKGGTSNVVSWALGVHYEDLYYTELEQFSISPYRTENKAGAKVVGGWKGPSSIVQRCYNEFRSSFGPHACALMPLRHDILQYITHKKEHTAEYVEALREALRCDAALRKEKTEESRSLEVGPCVPSTEPPEPVPEAPFIEDSPFSTAVLDSPSPSPLLSAIPLPSSSPTSPVSSGSRASKMVTGFLSSLNRALRSRVMCSPVEAAGAAAAYRALLEYTTEGAPSRTTTTTPRTLTSLPANGDEDKASATVLARDEEEDAPETDASEGENKEKKEEEGDGVGRGGSTVPEPTWISPSLLMEYWERLTGTLCRMISSEKTMGVTVPMSVSATATTMALSSSTAPLRKATLTTTATTTASTTSRSGSTSIPLTLGEIHSVMLFLLLSLEAWNAFSSSVASLAPPPLSSFASTLSGSRRRDKKTLPEVFSSAQRHLVQDVSNAMKALLLCERARGDAGALLLAQAFQPYLSNHKGFASVVEQAKRRLSRLSHPHSRIHLQELLALPIPLAPVVVEPSLSNPMPGSTVSSSTTKSSGVPMTSREKENEPSKKEGPTRSFPLAKTVFTTSTLSSSSTAVTSTTGERAWDRRPPPRGEGTEKESGGGRETRERSSRTPPRHEPRGKEERRRDRFARSHRSRSSSAEKQQKRARRERERSDPPPPSSSSLSPFYKREAQASAFKDSGGQSRLGREKEGGSRRSHRRPRHRR